MRTRANDVRECFILGHRLQIYLHDTDHWRVVVDDEEILALCQPLCRLRGGSLRELPPGQDTGLRVLAGLTCRASSLGSLRNAASACTCSCARLVAAS